MIVSKPLLVGEDNPYGSDPRYALYPAPDGSAGERLCRLVMGLGRSEYLRSFDRVNLCSGKWSVREARENALHLVVASRAVRVVLLGAKVCAAVGIEYEPFSAWRVLATMAVPDRIVCVLPHPSSQCRLWHKPGAFARARTALREARILPPDVPAVGIDLEDLPSTDEVADRRPARCANCGGVVQGRDCSACGADRRGA